MPWSITAANQVGTSHAKLGQACADAFALRQEEGFVAVAVADGAGSARLGGQGARLAADRAADLVVALLGEQPLLRGEEPAFVRRVFQGALDTLLAACADIDPAGPVQLSALHTTLLLFVLLEDRLLAGNIGDGWLIARDRAGRLFPIAPPEPSEHCNETFFLTSDHALDDAVIEVVPAEDLDGVAAMTDGPSWFAVDLETRRPGEALFGKLFAFAADPALSADDKADQLTAFLRSESVCRLTDDDKTLVLAVRPAPSPGELEPPSLQT